MNNILNAFPLMARLTKCRSKGWYNGSCLNVRLELHVKDNTNQSTR